MPKASTGSAQKASKGLLEQFPMNKSAQSKAADSRAKPLLSMPQMVLVGLVLGIACGLFFGEEAARIEFIGDMYIGLLQMMVLPYVILSLVSGIGKLTLSQAKQLTKYAILVLLALWGVIGSILVFLPLAFPEMESASFYSTGLLNPPQHINLINIFIPKNVFKSLSNNQVPAIVVFCIALGIALITSKEKQDLLKLLDILSDTVIRVIKFVVNLTPIGVFAMTASATGTITFQELGRLQGYFLAYTVAVLLLAFWVLPGLIVSFTPFRFKDVIVIAWSAIVLSFAAGKVLIALPLIIESLKTLFNKYDIKDKEAVSIAEVLVPISYPFPMTGKLVSLLFIPFAAWFMGELMPLGDYPAFLVSGLLSYFGNVAVAMPFLLDIMKLPADMFQLFLLTGIYCGRISDGLGAMDLFAFASLVACASMGIMRVHWRRLILVIAGTVVMGTVSIFGMRAYFSEVFEDSYNKDEIIASMQLLDKRVPATIVERTPNPVPLKSRQSTLGRIKERGVIRIGFHPDHLPFSYFNAMGELVGFDIDMAYNLALELDVRIEFVPFDFSSLAGQLDQDHFDLVMAGVPASTDRSANIRFSDPYLFLTTALVVPDHRDVEFATLESIRELEKVKFGVHKDFAYRRSLYSADAKVFVPQAKIVFLDSYRDFFEQKGSGKGVDALITSAEGGSAWTLLYPQYQVATPFSDKYTVPLVYPYSGNNDSSMDEFIDHWVMLKQHDGGISRAYNHWILGKGSKQKVPRWSIMRDVLHWAD
jgi:Na+/H+-dicarboxylate symporter